MYTSFRKAQSEYIKNIDKYINIVCCLLSFILSIAFLGY